MVLVVAAVVAAAGIGVAAPAQARAGAGASGGTLLVRFRPGLSVAAARAVVALHGASLGEEIPHTGFFEVSAATAVEVVRDGLAADARVETVEANAVRSATAVPTDPRYATKQAGYLSALHLPEAWDLSTGADEVVLAVVDSGVSPVPDLAGRLLPGRDIVNGDDDATDDYGHGTEVATVAAATTGNGVGMAGIAWRGKVLPVKVLDGAGRGTDADIAAGITWAADHGADVINLSLGAQAYSATLKAAVDYARSRDIVVVAAAGNDKSSRLVHPAGIDGVVAVSAVDPDGTFSSYSNWGSWIDLAAPGDVLAGGRDGAYRMVEGTSYAAPIVSAVALLARARFPAETADQIVIRLRGGARDAGPLGVDDRYGYGIVDALGALGGPKPPRAPEDPATVVREPDNTPGRATVIGAGVAVDGYLAEGDVDWFAVDLPAAQWIRATVGGGPLVDLYGPDLAAPGGGGDGAIEGNLGSQYVYAPPGRYYARVRPKGSSPKAYTVRIETIPAPARLFEGTVDELGTGARPRSVVSGDVTGDGRDDVIATVAATVGVDRNGLPVDRHSDDRVDGPLGSVVVLAQDGDSFRPTVLPALLGIDGSTGLALGDLDGDGDQDLAAGSDQGVTLYLQGPGGLGDIRFVPLAAVDQIETGDVDGDGRRDLVVTTTSGSGGVVWLRNTGGGVFEAQPVTSAAVAEVEVADTDGDGRDDIVVLVCGPACGEVEVFRFTGAGLSATPVPVGVSGGPADCGLGVGDVIGDARPDVFTACTGAGRVEVHAGTPGGTFGPGVVVDEVGEQPLGLEAVDLDGDGSSELAVLHENSDVISVLRRAADGTLALALYLDLGVGSYGPKGFAFGTFGPAVGIAAAGRADTLLLRRRAPVDSGFHGPRYWIRDTVPADGSAGGTPDSTPTVVFTRPLDPASLDTRSVRLSDASTGEPVDAAVSYDPATYSVAVHPARALTAGHAYLLRLEAVRDSTGALLPDDADELRFLVGGPTGVKPADGGAVPEPDTPSGPARPVRSGYWMVGADGSVYSFGEARYHDGAVPSRGAEVVDLEPTRSGDGYWIVDSAGVVTARGDADFFGHADPIKLAKGERVTSLSATPTGRGYWLFTSRGRVLALGDAPFLGDVSAVRLNGPVLDSIPTPSGRGYYMVASDGGIFAFGDAVFVGSMGGTKLNAPVQSLVPDPDGAGYWLVASDGGVFAFDAPFRGSLGGIRLNRPVTGMVPSGNGYLMVGEDGGLFNFSDRPFAGSLGADPPPTPIVSVAALP